MDSTRMGLFALSIILICWMSSVSAKIFFYLEPGQKQFFVEHLAKHTVFLGNYTTTVYNEMTKSYVYDPSLQVQLTVEAGGEVLMNQMASPNGRFFFTSAESLEHLITVGTLQDSWYGKRVKMNLEVYVGDPGETNITPPIKAHLDGLSRTISTLNALVQDIRHNQYQHRQRQSEFRDRSETVNSSVVWWILIQLCVLLITCYLQLKHLESFFRAKKLV